MANNSRCARFGGGGVVGGGGGAPNCRARGGVAGGGGGGGTQIWRSIINSNRDSTFESRSAITTWIIITNAANTAFIAPSSPTTSTYYYLVPSTSSTLATTLLPPTTTRFCSSYVYFMVSRVPLPVPARLSLLLLLGVCTRPNSRHKKLARRQTTKHHFQLQSST